MAGPAPQTFDARGEFDRVGVSIIMPAYNEEANVGEAIRRAVEVAEELGLDYEVIAVDDGSTDRTRTAARAAAAGNDRIHVCAHDTNRGYGAALRTGFEASGKGLIFFTDSDLQFEMRELAKLLARSRDHDIVMGYRLHRRDGLMRSFKARAWNSLVRLLFGYLGRDVDCAFKLVNRPVLTACPLRSSGALINVELLVKAKALRFRFVEVPVRHRPRQHGANTGASPRVMVRALAELMSFLWESKGSRAHRRRAAAVMVPAGGDLSGDQPSAHR